MINKVLASIFFLLGCLTILCSMIGVFKFKFVMNRMHCVAVIDSIGFFFIAVALIIYSHSFAFVWKLILVLCFQWIGSPIASHMVARLELETDENLEEHMKKEDEE